MGKDRIEDQDFENRGFMANMRNFWRFMLSGSDKNTNIVAQMSSVSVFAMLDKQGVCTENQKYVDELALLDANENIVNLDFTHQQSEVPEKEAKVYLFDGAEERFNRNRTKPTALSLAIMLARNPKEDDLLTHLREVFMVDGSQATEEEKSQVKKQPGFHFHNSAWSENEYHQDCACSLSIMLGQSEMQFQNYEHKMSFW